MEVDMAVNAITPGDRTHWHAIVDRRPEVLLVRCAIAFVVLHVVVDSAIAPEPGTGIGDHLSRAVTSLAVLAAAALAYPRLRPGARAVMASGRVPSRKRRVKYRTIRLD